MRRLLANSALVLTALLAALLAAPRAAGADPVIGAALDVGESLGSGDAELRVGTGLYVAQPLRGGWLLGGQLDGSLEGYTGGYGCGTNAPLTMPVPSIGVACLQPTVGLHLLVGTQAASGPRSLLRLEERALATDDLHTARSLALVFEGRSR